MKKSKNTTRGKKAASKKGEKRIKRRKSVKAENHKNKIASLKIKKEEKIKQREKIMKLIESRNQ
jgi:hypothetical protein